MENRHTALDLIEQHGRNGRLVYSISAETTPGAEAFQDTRPMQWMMPNRRQMSIGFAVALIIVGCLVGIAVTNVGLWLLRWLQW